MDAMVEVLEQELEGAFEVKDKKITTQVRSSFK